MIPSTVGALFVAAGLTPDGVVAWGETVPRPKPRAARTGVYVVALTSDADRLKGALAACPLARGALQRLLDARAELTLHRGRPDADRLGERLAGFWCADEVVLYIGRAGPRKRITISPLSDRVQEYYDTALGARSPHAGGWPLKTLSVLAKLLVHYAYCADFTTAEELMLDAFAENVSDATRESLFDSSVVMPFANLEDGHGRRERQGIRGARAPRTPGRQARGRIPLSPSPARARQPVGSPTGKVTAVELAARLNVDPKRLRAWLRAMAQSDHPLLATHEHYGRWFFTEKEALQLAAEYLQARSS